MNTLGWCCASKAYEAVTAVIDCLSLLFFGHRPNFFLNERKKLSHFSHNVWKGRLANIDSASFNTIPGLVTEMSQKKIKFVEQSMMMLVRWWHGCVGTSWLRALRNGDMCKSQRCRAWDTSCPRIFLEKNIWQQFKDTRRFRKYLTKSFCAASVVPAWHVSD